jgi:hypothetical protein
MQKNRHFVDIDNLILEVFVIGYPDKGESQIILIKDTSTSRCIFSCVIDCYRYKNINTTIDILKANNIELLDIFIWTHTDEDHSLGISDLVATFCSNKTKFILPEFVYGNKNDLINYNAEIQGSFDLINSHNTWKNLCVSSIAVVPLGNSTIFELYYIDIQTNFELKFVILAVAPCSPMLRLRWGAGRIGKKNDFSIATIFKIGEINLFFGGDIEDNTIQHIADYHFENLSYIKTPHHTSTTSTYLVDKLVNNSVDAIPSAVSTIYKIHNLPHVDVVEKYKKVVSNFYSTGIGENNDGFVKTTFHILSNKILDEVLSGNAELL